MFLTCFWAGYTPGNTCPDLPMSSMLQTRHANVFLKRFAMMHFDCGSVHKTVVPVLACSISPEVLGVKLCFRLRKFVQAVVPVLVCRISSIKYCMYGPFCDVRHVQFDSADSPKTVVLVIKNCGDPGEVLSERSLLVLCKVPSEFCSKAAFGSAFWTPIWYWTSVFFCKVAGYGEKNRYKMELRGNPLHTISVRGYAFSCKMTFRKMF